MNRFFKNRVIPLILVFSIVFSLLVVPAQATSAIGGQIAAGKTTLTEALGDYPSFFEGVATYIRNMEFGNADAPYYPGVSLYSRITEEAFLFDVGSVENLYAFATAINSNDVGVKCSVTQTGSGVNDYYYIQYISITKSSGGGFGRADATQGLTLKYTVADENGWILVASVAAAGDVEGQWLTYNNTLPQDMVSYEQLEAMRLGMQNYGVNCSLTKMDVGYVLTMSTGTPPYYVTKVYCNPWGGMYVAPADDRVVSGDRIHIDGDGNQINVGIDLEGGTINLPDGGELEINQVIYDDSTHTYYVDGTDESGTVYSYSFNYNIDYTSITYIGQTAEYNKYYEVYYELPDGRSSADLTAEELEQLNVSIDVVPYVRYSDDTSVRALYHFDGDTRDSSYWNYQSEFDWKMGSSITYMDAGVFKGALYMDETVNHAFSISLPSNLGSKDFTIQWRYYQSYTATAATAPDGYVNIDGIDVFSWNGKKFYSGLGASELGATSTGQWLELALIRSSGTLYFYVNGLPIGSVADTNPYGDQLTFGFGALQKTYKYFDELRVLNFAYVEDGADYTPTSVPHDTNLALVLPNSMTPVADEYWIFDTEGNLLTPYDFTALDSYSFIEDLGAVTDYNNNSNWQTGYHSARNQKITLYADDGYTRFTGSSATGTANGVLFIPLYTASTSKINTQHITGHEFVYGNEYVFSVMLADGSLYSVPFVAYDKTEDSAGTLDRMTELPDGSSIAFDGVSYGNSTYKLFGIKLTIPDGQSLDIVYMELKQGIEPNTGHEFVTEVVGVDKDALKTPTLAVKTDLYISGYQIGGVRPSVPEKGLVWALVEGGVIKSLQIYTGSAWEAVDGRIWTGSRWVPLSSYNVLLLKDMYDITGVVTPDDYEYIYTEAGFWSWLQKWLNDFKAALFNKLDQIIDGSGSGTNVKPSDCEHAYAIVQQSDPTCTDPGKTVYSCPICGDSYAEYEDALEHDWIQKESVEDTYALPSGVRCPSCAGTNYESILSGDQYECVCSSCETAWTERAEVKSGYTLHECSRCGEQKKEYNDTGGNIFEAIGNFLSDGVYWISDKLQQLVRSFSSITEIFNAMGETIKQYASNFSGLFGEFLALMPQDLMTVVWFGLILIVVLLAWKKWFG